MRVSAFITDRPTIHDILVDPGKPRAPPRIGPGECAIRAASG
jgi:hypothetical protein